MGFSLFEQRELPTQYRRDAMAALAHRPVVIPTKYLFDDRGGELFASFRNASHAHYGAREMQLLQCMPVTTWAKLDSATDIVDLGAGDCAVFREFVRPRLGRPTAYKPIDMSGRVLLEHARDLAAASNLEVRAFIADFETLPLNILLDSQRPTLLIWLGNTVANAPTTNIEALLTNLRAASSRDSQLLLGVDLNGSYNGMKRAYEDTEGFFDAFRWNALERLNRELESDLRRQNFMLRSAYNHGERQGESFLEALVDHDVGIGLSRRTIRFHKGDRLVIGMTKTYSADDIEALARQTDWRIAACHTLPGESYALLHLLQEPKQ